MVSLVTKQLVNEVLDSDMDGSKVKHFESQFAQAHGARYAIAVRNNALLVILSALKYLNNWEDGGEISVPDMGPVGAIASVVNAGLCPVFNHLAIDAVACVHAHLFGLPTTTGLTVPSIKPLIIEQPALGMVDGVRVGEMRDVSYYRTPHGQVILTNSECYNNIFRMFAGSGPRGYSVEMSDLEAAFGLAFLEEEPERIKERNVFAGDVYIGLSGLPLLLSEIPGDIMTHSFDRYLIQIDDDTNRDSLVKYLNENNIAAEPVEMITDNEDFKEMFGRDFGSHFSEQKVFEKKAFTIPCENYRHVIRTFKRFYKPFDVKEIK